MNGSDEKATKSGQQRRVLLEPEAKALLEQWGIPTVSCEVAGSADEAIRSANALGFPVALKILSPDVVHKTEAGGVRLNLHTDQDVRSAFAEIVTNVKSSVPSAKISGVTVQKMVSGIEVALGVANDLQFGPVFMFGMGGVLVELLKDTAFRLIPVSCADADEMMREIKGFPLLQGYRGVRADLNSLRDVLLKVSDLAAAQPNIEEMDLNPVIASPSGSLVADARLVLARSGA